MANYPQTQLATQVLRDLNAIDASEAPDTEDETYVIGKYGTKYEELADDELCYWPLDAIPGAIFQAVCDLVALEVMGTYGTPQAPEDKEAREEVLLRRLRKHMRKRSSGLPVKAVYF